MAVVTVKSGAITNRDTSPQVKNGPHLEGGILRESVATVEVTTGNSSLSLYVLHQIPSNARVSDLLIYSDDMGTATAADFGIWQTTANGGAVVDADHFASAVSLNGGALTASSVAHEAGVFNVDDVEKPLWQALGLSSDPKIMYDVVAQLTADADVGGTLSTKLTYVV